MARYVPSDTQPSAPDPTPAQGVWLRNMSDGARDIWGQRVLPNGKIDVPAHALSPDADHGGVYDRMHWKDHPFVRARILVANAPAREMPSLAAFSDDGAIKRVDVEGNTETLASWYASEERDKVRTAIRARQVAIAHGDLESKPADE